MAGENSIEQLLESYPQLIREDILACIAYGAAMSRENYVTIDSSHYEEN